MGVGDKKQTFADIFAAEICVWHSLVHFCLEDHVKDVHSDQTCLIFLFCGETFGPAHLHRQKQVLALV